MPLFWKDEVDGVVPSSAKQLDISEMNRYVARDLNAIWHSRLPHYDTGFCLNSLVSYGASYLNVYYAIAIWTNPVAAALPPHEWLELRRMAISPEAPKYTASYMLGKMVRQLGLNFPKLILLFLTKTWKFIQVLSIKHQIGLQIIFILGDHGIGQMQKT